jgi:hypothetical protein
MSLGGMLRNPYLRRELEIRASGDEGYRLFNYSGPGLYLLLLQLPVVYGLIATGFSWSGAAEAWTAPLFLVTVWLGVLYFSHSAARFCSGSLVVERERGTIDALRLVPRPSTELFAGKYLAAIAPLLVEALITFPFLSIYAAFRSVPWIVVGAVSVLNFGLIAFFGVWGMFWSVSSRDVLSAVSRAFCTVLGFNLLPLVLGLVIQLSDNTSCHGLLMVSPLVLATRLVQAGVQPQAASPDGGLVACLLLIAALVFIVLRRVSLGRLSAR